MSNWGSLERFLKTDPADAGCAETFELLERYVERSSPTGTRQNGSPGSPPTCRVAIRACRTSRDCSRRLPVQPDRSVTMANGWR